MEYTKGPWKWGIMDYSMATLHQADKDIDESHIMSVSPCSSCADRRRDKGWQWGVCLTPNEADAKLIEAAPDLLVALQKAIIELEQYVPISNADVLRNAYAAVNKAIL